MKTSALLATALLALGGFANDPLTEDKVEADITTRELQNNLWHLNKIARDNGGNRAFGLPGYAASSDYVMERAQTRFHKQMDTYKQYFNHTFEQTREIKLTGPDGADVYVLTLLYNHPTPAGGITAELIDTPVNDATGSGCLESDWTGIDATGKIALVKRGTCAISDKLKLAKAHGALAVVLYNQSPGTPVSSATLGAENIGLLVPVATTSLEVGTAWKSRLAAGESLTVTVLVDSIFEIRESWNIISETKEGDPNSVVVLGAHLDSVQAGPGVNDDGSGTTALLEIMGSVKKYSGFKNKLRFIWWGAEEAGLIGSNFYTSPGQMSEEEADKIRFYANFDMIGSPFPEFVVYQDPDFLEGSAVGSQYLADYLTANGKPATFESFATNSDYYGFLQRGIAATGIFTGAGAPTDPCYHLACDNLENINWDALTVNAKAAGRLAARLALSLDGIPPRKKSSPAKRDARAIRREFQRWAAVEEHASHAKSCSHKSDNRI
ncbi:hypothetical protein PspLS_10560 [Pyricularia sp. CBS 133598]|nr:hypothetical protein PspLS_10560 [Pyricularia sp. CBS 133598]